MYHSIASLNEVKNDVVRGTDGFSHVPRHDTLNLSIMFTPYIREAGGIGTVLI